MGDTPEQTEPTREAIPELEWQWLGTKKFWLITACAFVVDKTAIEHYVPQPGVVGAGQCVFAVRVGVFLGVCVACRYGCAKTSIGRVKYSATIIHTKTIAVSGLRFTAFPPLDLGAGVIPAKVYQIRQ